MPWHNVFKSAPPLAVDNDAITAPAGVEKDKSLCQADVDAVGEKLAVDYSDEKTSQTFGSGDDSSVRYVNGEPVITTGRDVSKYLVDLRDDGDPAITFRSLVCGTVIGALGSALITVSDLTWTCIMLSSLSFPRSRSTRSSPSLSMSRLSSSCCSSTRLAMLGL